MSIYRRVFRYYQSFLPQTIAGLVLSLIGIGLNLLKPWPFKIIVDYVLPADSAFRLRHPDWRQYILHFHTSAKELAELATKAKPKLLVLYHQMFFGGEQDTEEGLLKEMQEHYRGKVVSAHDLDIY